MRVFLNLCEGLKMLGVGFRVNDYRYIRCHPEEVACIIGKPHVLDKIAWSNPILFGAAVYSHPSDDPELFQRLDIRKVLVPGEWMREMCEPFWGEKVAAWPVGIDTDKWCEESDSKHYDVLIYDKVRWEHERYENELISPIRTALKERGLSFAEIRYGYYREEDFKSLIQSSRSMIFLCEHETQGIAYQQALACGVPILAWDRGGFWQDPNFYPERVKYGPVSSVPYWDERCGMKFKNADELKVTLDVFLATATAKGYRPRDYVMENLTLQKSALAYLDHWNDVS